jgi:hypothetical protein
MADVALILHSSVDCLMSLLPTHGHDFGTCLLAHSLDKQVIH